MYCKPYEINQDQNNIFSEISFDALRNPGTIYSCNYFSLQTTPVEGPPEKAIKKERKPDPHHSSSDSRLSKHSSSSSAKKTPSSDSGHPMSKTPTTSIPLPPLAGAPPPGLNSADFSTFNPYMASHMFSSSFMSQEGSKSIQTLMGGGGPQGKQAPVPDKPHGAYPSAAPPATAQSYNVPMTNPQSFPPGSYPPNYQPPSYQYNNQSQQPPPQTGSYPQNMNYNAPAQPPAPQQYPQQPVMTPRIPMSGAPVPPRMPSQQSQVRAPNPSSSGGLTVRISGRR